MYSNPRNFMNNLKNNNIKFKLILKNNLQK